MRLRLLPALIEKIGGTGLGVGHSVCSLPWLWGARATQLKRSLAALGAPRLGLAVLPRRIGGHTSTLPSLPIALLICSSLTSSPSSISLCALPEGIMGKQLARAATRQSKSTGLSAGALSMAKIAWSRSAGLLHIMPMPP